MTVCSNPERGSCFRFFIEKYINSDRGEGMFYSSFLPVVIKIMFNGILADFWHQRFDSNGFLVQLIRILSQLAQFESIFICFSLVKYP